jgi:hypothetical protein
VSGESYLPLVEFLEKNFGLKWCDEDTERDFKVRLSKIKGNKVLYLTRNKTNSVEIIMEDIINWINSNLKKSGYRQIEHCYRYDKFKKDKKGECDKWVFERIEEKGVKN